MTWLSPVFREQSSLFLRLFSAVAAENLSLRETYNFNPQWKLHTGEGAFEAPAVDDSAWQPVTLPHAWNEDSAFAVDIHDHPTGNCVVSQNVCASGGCVRAKVFLELKGRVRVRGFM